MKSSTAAPSFVYSNVLKLFWFVLVLAPLHELLFGGAPLRHIVNAGSANGCPFKATRTYLGRQASSLRMALPSLTMFSSPSTSARTSYRFETSLKVATADEKIVAVAAGEVAKKEKAKKSSPDALEVLVLGLSHHTAGVDVREKLAIPEADWNKASSGLVEYNSISGKRSFVLLITTPLTMLHP
jgi:hypothetical protein